jgi:tetratricopeptide (TPR) repeat protein
VSRRTRLLVTVAAAALVAAGAVVGIALILEDEGQGRGGPREGAPPLVLDLGLRTDREAVALRRAERLYADGRREEAQRVFERFDSPEAELGSAFARWPRGSLARVELLVERRPRDARMLLHLGFARFWAGRDREAIAAWRTAARVEPDSPSAARADDLLHRDFPSGRPVFVPSFPLPATLTRVSAPRQLAELARRARRQDVRAKLLYGVALQRLGRRISAQRQFDAAARLDPADPEARVATAVVRFDKARPAVAFSRLGPLTRRFPRAQTVRFHLGLLLLWLARVQSGAVDEGKAQLRRAHALGPRTPLGREAKRLLDRLAAVETG